MAATSTSGSHGSEDETLAVAVGGNALNPEGEATHNPDRLGAGTPDGTPEPEVTDTAADSSGSAQTNDDGQAADPATDGEGDALDNDEIEEQADDLSE
jgi:hypothetical protein